MENLGDCHASALLYHNDREFVLPPSLRQRRGTPRTCEGGKASNHQFLKLPRSGTLTFNFQLSTFNFYDYYKKTQFS